ncbi:MAG: NADH-quinone oxidoreductase subunit L [Bacteroidota bacterium]|nr:NADH-quinone oxidoreductase subunit L [Bacteroidota bacterium]MDP4233786.1 NADH-quinone oxidoreductase subunit L [Bacteroidota bacterium]MDP4242425.1 NADH-quinone oxidoreductase subunit L [Bacteroidota bacterium]MDP4287547.1 NADH-quinone oxidoreductase subunit L [Bacteroidota bacterium]
MSDFIPIIVLAPIAALLINLFFGSRMRGEMAGWIATGAVAISFFVTLGLFSNMLGWPPEQRTIHFHWLDWIHVGRVNVDISYLIDQLSIIFMLVITGVGSLIHLYSISYMKGDRGYWRFFVYLNLFIVMMLQLVMADNYLLTFVGWEGVGLCSYLLIGFWYDEKKNNDAAKKAFIVNRIGDFGFLVAMGAMLWQFKSLNYLDILGSGGNVVDGVHHIGMATTLAVGAPIATIITLMLFLGCTGKSAQIPLYVWLPDAMAGPTPVSALIHAATMVTSGIFLVARSNILFALSPTTLSVVAGIGAATAIFAAMIGIFQNDIKKVLAYSTVSQLGYMFLALGVGAFTAGVFHVVTHAFFKACLFLGSGAVIHAMHHEQDMQKMGGLGKYLPITFWTFLIATLAIAGIPPFAGFFSKDEILWQAFSRGSVVLWLIGALAALMTAFYMFRVIYLTFYGTERFDTDHHEPHEVDWRMWLPLVVLAALSIGAGFLGMPSVFGAGNWFEKWLEPVVSRGEEISKVAGAAEGAGLEWALMAVSVGIAVAGILLAARFYKRRLTLAKDEAQLGAAYQLMHNKFYVDELYDKTVIQPIYNVSNGFLYKIVDVRVIDGIINGLAHITEIGSGMIRRIQTGIVQNYAVLIVVGLFVLVGYLVMF